VLRVLAIVVLAALLTSGTVVLAGSVYLVSGGVAYCDVDTPDVRLSIPVPTRLADIALRVARFSIPDQQLEEMRREAGPYRPLVETVLSALSEVPDGTRLVSVDTVDAKVSIGREDGRMIIDVDADDARVHVSFPARAFARLGRGVGSLLGPSV